MTRLEDLQLHALDLNKQIDDAQDLTEDAEYVLSDLRAAEEDLRVEFDELQYEINEILDQEKDPRMTVNTEAFTQRVRNPTAADCLEWDLFVLSHPTELNKLSNTPNVFEEWRLDRLKCYAAHLQEYDNLPTFVTRHL